MWRLLVQSRCLMGASLCREMHSTTTPLRVPSKKRVKHHTARKVSPVPPSTASPGPEPPREKAESSVRSLASAEAIVAGVELSLASGSDPVRASSPTLAPQPDAVDYRALLLDLLLYRKETVAPVLTALVAERHLLEARMHALDEKVAELAQIRDDIRQMLQEQTAMEEARLLRVVAQLQQRQQQSPVSAEMENASSLSHKHRGHAAEDGGTPDEEFVL